MRFLAKIALVIFLLTPSLAKAKADTVDYDALTHKVRKSVYIHQQKKGISLNSTATKSLLAQSFVGQIVKGPLTNLEPHLLYACAMPDLYDENSINLDLDSRVPVNRFALFQAARKYDLKKRFPTNDKMKLKKLYKIDDKKMKYYRKHWERNKFLPQTAVLERGEVNPWVADVDLVSDIRAKCDSALSAVISKHKEPILKFIEDAVHSKVETTVK